MLAWMGIVVAESLHGALRQAFLVPRIGDLPARQWGVLTGSLIILAIAVATARWIGAGTVGERLRIGAVWTLLILAFECGLGRALGFSWERIVSDYDLRQGGFMLFGLLFLFLSPTLAAWLREHIGRPGRTGGAGHRNPDD